MTYLNAPKFKNPKTGNLGLIFDEITDDTRLISIVSKPIIIVVVDVVIDLVFVNPLRPGGLSFFI